MTHEPIKMSYPEGYYDPWLPPYEMYSAKQEEAILTNFDKHVKAAEKGGYTVDVSDAPAYRYFAIVEVEGPGDRFEAITCPSLTGFDPIKRMLQVERFVDLLEGIELDVKTFPRKAVI